MFENLRFGSMPLRGRYLALLWERRSRRRRGCEDPGKARSLASV